MELQSEKKPNIQERRLEVPGLSGHGWASLAPRQHCTWQRGH